MIVGPTVRGLDYARDDERLLRAGNLLVRVAVIRDRCLSYGVGVRSTAPFLARAEREGIATVPRTSGGTALLHEPGDIAWSIVIPRTDRRVGRQFARAYDRLGRGVVRFLRSLGVEARWIGAPGAVPDYCTLSARGSVLSSDGRIVGGAAQHLTGAALLHHGTLSRNVDRVSIDRLFELEPGGPSTLLGGLRELGVDSAPDALTGLLARAIAEDLTRDRAT